MKQEGWEPLKALEQDGSPLLWQPACHWRQGFLSWLSLIRTWLILYPEACFCRLFSQHGGL